MNKKVIQKKILLKFNNKLVNNRKKNILMKFFKTDFFIRIILFRNGKKQNNYQLS